MWGPPGTFGPDCLESLTPGAYTSEGSLFSSMAVCRPDMELGQLRCLRAFLLEMPFLSTVITSPSLFTWVSLGILLRLFQSRYNSLCWGFSLLPDFFVFSYFIPYILYHNILSEPAVTVLLKTDLVQTPVFITYGRYLEPTW